MMDLQTAGDPVYFYYDDGLGSVAALSNASYNGPPGLLRKGLF